MEITRNVCRPTRGKYAGKNAKPTLPTLGGMNRDHPISRPDAGNPVLKANPIADSLIVEP